MGLRRWRTVRKFNNLRDSTVRRIKANFDKFIAEGGYKKYFNVLRKPLHNLTSDAHTMELVNQIQEIINEDLGTSMRKIERELNMSEGLIRS